MTKRRLLALGTMTACLAACGSSSTLTGPGSSGPGAGLYVLSGVVSETLGDISRPLAGKQVDLWMQQGGGGFRQIVGTDQNGRYTATVPPVRIFATAWGDGLLQPCLASAEMRSDTTLDIQLVPTANLASIPTASPRITGVVHEATPQGRVPVRGALISADVVPYLEVYVATTRTDDAGRFTLCRMNASVGLVVGAIGYEGWTRDIPQGTNDIDLDVELKRLP